MELVENKQSTAKRNGLKIVWLAVVANGLNRKVCKCIHTSHFRCKFEASCAIANFTFNHLSCSTHRKLKRKSDSLIEAFVIGAVNKSLTTVFGEIGGQTELDLLSFDSENQKGILRVPSNFLTKLQIALTLIADFQGIPAIFSINQATSNLSALLISA